MAKKTERKAIKIIVVDDEALARKRIIDLIDERDDFEVVGECSCGQEAVDMLGSLEADIVFLDIQMPDFDGFEVVKNFEISELPKIIFVTAYDQYALRAFEIHAIDYLLKPFDDERFDEMLAHARKQIARDDIHSLGGQLTELLAELGAARSEHAVAETSSRNGYPKRLVVKSTGRISFIEVGEIDWIGAEGSYVSLNTNGKAHLMRGSLKNLESMLNPDSFIRIHRSTIVNVESIKELKSHFHGEFQVTLKTGKRLKLSRNYRENAERLLGGSL